MSGLDEKKKARYQECFNYNDKKGKGTIESKDLGLVMRSLGLNPTEAELKDFTTEAGATLTFDQFLKYATKPLKTNPSEEEMREAFKVFDKDGQGFLSAAELRHIMTNLGERLSKEELEEMIKEADTNKDGNINYASFVKLMLHL